MIYPVILSYTCITLQNISVYIWLYLYIFTEYIWFMKYKPSTLSHCLFHMDSQTNGVAQHQKSYKVCSTNLTKYSLKSWIVYSIQNTDKSLFTSNSILLTSRGRGLACSDSQYIENV